ncbi:MAG: aminoglycoside phosphotransferase family protein [Deltaproteobacteria bacterium]|nr:aminoglycoside phosphotransferase family protein [Deltaproteobacteria bacterium]
MDLDWIASATGAQTVRRRARLEELWGGYGELHRVELDGRTAVVKWARSPGTDVSSRRKARSFAVETAFYRGIAPRCDDTCRVPALLAAREGDGEWHLVLEDLDAAGFSGRTDEASGAQLDAVLAWLASFHARFAGETFADLWPTGTYWHLDTRRDELPRIADRALRDAATDLARRLADARHQTLLHGDAKDANFCFARTGAVAAVDFQYAGRGCAMSDVAYLLYGRADEPDDGIDRARLDTYFRLLRRALPPGIDAAALEAEGRALYPVARLDFCRFLAGWRPAAWRRDERGRRFVRAMLS